MTLDDGVLARLRVAADLPDLGPRYDVRTPIGHGGSSVVYSAWDRDLARGLYASAMVARVDPGDGAVDLVSAGHQAPAIRLDAAAGQMRKLQPNGIALGFDRGPVFRNALETVQLTLEVGDGLFLFSPELYAATSPKGQELGESGAAQLAKIALEQDLDAVVRRLESFLGGPPEADLGFALLRRDAAV